MDWSQLIIQLGISALVIFVGYQLALRLIASWSASDAARTAAFATGMKDMSDTMRNGLKDLRDAMAAGLKDNNDKIAAISKDMSNMTGRIEQVLDLTPVREMRAIHEQHERNERKVIVTDDHPYEEEHTPPAKPPPRKTPPKGMPYGPFTRPKTSGGDR